MTTTFIAIYRGSEIGKAELVAVSADPELVADVACRLLRGDPIDGPGSDPILSLSHEGRRRALRAIYLEARQDGAPTGRVPS